MFRAGLINRPQLIDRSKRIKSKFRSLAVAYWDSCDREVANLANAFGEHLGRLFTFLEESGVEPTNNTAEQALRTAVQWRKDQLWQPQLTRGNCHRPPADRRSK